MKRSTGFIVGALIFIAVVLIALNFGDERYRVGTKIPGLGGGSGGSGLVSQNSEIEIVNEIPQEGDWFEIEGYEISGNELIVRTSYSGCPGGIFNAYSTAGQGFKESAPVQTNVYFVYSAAEGVCDVSIGSETFRFGLGNLRDEYADQYGRSDGTILLNVVDYDGSLVQNQNNLYSF